MEAAHAAAAQAATLAAAGAHIKAVGVLTKAVKAYGGPHPLLLALRSESLLWLCKRGKAKEDADAVEANWPDFWLGAALSGRIHLETGQVTGTEGRGGGSQCGCGRWMQRWGS
jgi:hypothetical protein